MPRLLLSFSPAAMLVLLFLVFSPATAEARYGGHISIGYGHHGYGHHSYGYHGYGHRGYRSRHYGYRHYPYRYGYKRHYYRHYRYNYRHRSYSGRSYSGHRSYSDGKHRNPLVTILTAPAYLAYGILKTPAVIVDSLTGDDDHGADSDSRHRQGVKSATDTTTAVHDEPYTAQTLLEEPGWQALANGYDREALRRFAEQAQASPHNGVPKIGYALSAASNGNLERGIWAIQRALRRDNEAFVYLPLDGALRQTVGNLIRQYESRYEQSDYPGRYSSDGAIMIAALYYLHGNRDVARETIAAAQADDNSAALHQLQDLLAQSADEAPTTATVESQSEG